MTLTCLCCGFTAEFMDENAAYCAGWDTRAHFTIGPLCSLCPAAPVALHGLTAARLRHAPLHERWATDGRPADFSRADEYTLDGLSPREVDEHERGIAALKQLVDDYRRRTTN